MDYTLHQLRVFHRVAELQSVTKAAASLHLTQPAVSIQLKNFQRQFEIPLTEIVGRRLYVTEFGHEVAAAAKTILEEVAAIDFKAGAYRGLLTGRLHLSIVSTAKYVMPYFLTDFMRAHPGVTLQMDVTNKAGVLASLERNAVDLALVSVLPTQLDIDHVPLLPNALHLVGNSERDFGETVHERSLLLELPLIFREPGSGTRYTMEQFFARHGLEVAQKMELTTNEAVKQAVLAGLGYSILPLIGMREELAAGELNIIPVDGLPVTSTWQLIWMRRKKLSPLATAFLAYIDAERDRIVGERFG